MADDLQTAINLMKSGKKAEAGAIFARLVSTNPRNEAAWLWLAASVDDLKQKEFCFTRVLEINPNNENVQKALSQIKMPLSPSFDDLINATSRPDEVKYSNTLIAEDKVDIQALKCPMCGANIGLGDRECSYCSSTLIVTSIGKTLSRKSDTQLLSTSADQWKSILRTDPDNPEANYAMGLNYLNQKLRDAALHYLQKASLLMPDSAVVQYNLALTLFNDGELRLNSEEYEITIKAIDYANRLDPNFKEAKAFKHFFLGRKLDDVDFSKSIKEYIAAIDICPDIATFHNNLGFAYYRMKNYASAENSYLKAIEIDPEAYLPYSNLCHLGIATYHYKEGIYYGRKAIELLHSTTLDSSQAIVYNSLSFCLWKTNQTKEAIEMVKKAVAINPQEPLFRNNLIAYQNTLNSAWTKTSTILVLVFISVFVCIMLYAWLSSIH